jgi:hypothetical protein
MKIYEDKVLIRAIVRGRRQMSTHLRGTFASL